MTGRVFISHSSRDAALAHELVAALEVAGVACWISGRDVAPGANYQEAIVGAIRSGLAMIVLVSEAANASDEVKKELSLASAAGVAVYPVQLGDVTPNAALSYELATRQWIEGSEVAALARRLVAVIRGGVLPQPTTDAPAPLALPDKPSIAVLPFANIGGDAEQDYFADGMTEEVITALSRIRSFFVIARHASFAFKGRTIDVGAVGRQLGVRYVVEGSVRRGGNRVRIAAQLADAASGTQLWADRFDGDLADVFDLQDRVTASLVSVIEPRIRAEEIERARRKPPDSLRAYDLVLRAMPLLDSFSAEGLDRGAELLHRALTLDPGYGLAHSLAAMVMWWRMGQGRLRRTGEVTEKIRAQARAAIEHAPDDPEVLGHGGFMLALGAGDIHGGMTHLKKAAALNPNAARVLGLLAQVHGFLGEADAALALVERIRRLSPLLHHRQTDIAALLAHFGVGRYAEAIAEADAVIARVPTFTIGLRYRAACLGLLDRQEEARTTVARLLVLIPDFTVAMAAEHVALPDQPGRVHEFIAAYCEGLRRAGVPEE